MPPSYVCHDAFVCVQLLASHVWYIRRNHDPRMNESRSTWRMNESRSTWLMSHCTRTKELERDFTYALSYVERDSCIRVSWLLRMCDLPHSSIPYKHQKLLQRMNDRISGMWNIHTCAMTRWYVSKGSLLIPQTLKDPQERASQNRHCVSHKSFIRGRDSFIHVPWLVFACRYA